MWSLVVHMRHLKPAAHADTINYPAIDVRPWSYHYNLQYVDSVTRGESSLYRFIASFTSSCTTSVVFLAGYSQGAEVVDGVFQTLNPKLKPHVAGVVLFGDPRFDPAQTKPVDVGSFNPGKSGISIYQFQPPTGTFGTLAVYAPSEAAAVRSYCANHDQVCNFSSPAALVGCKVRCAHFHYMDLKVPRARLTYTQAAAAFLAGRATAKPTRTILCSLAAGGEGNVDLPFTATNVGCGEAIPIVKGAIACTSAGAGGCSVQGYTCALDHPGPAVPGSPVTCVDSLKKITFDLPG